MQNFLIDPVATSIEEASGVAIDEFVSLHTVEQLQESGVYRKVNVASASSDYDIEPDQDLTVYHDDKVRLTKYYGLVPRYLLLDAQAQLQFLEEQGELEEDGLEELAQPKEEEEVAET